MNEFVTNMTHDIAITIVISSLLISISLVVGFSLGLQYATHVIREWIQGIDVNPTKRLWKKKNKGQDDQK